MGKPLAAAKASPSATGVSPPSPPLRAGAIRVALLTWLCYLAMMCLALSFTQFPVILTRVQSNFALTAAQMGQAFSMIIAGTIVSVVVMAPLTSWTGPKTVMLLGCVLTLLGFTLECVSQSYLVLCMALFLQGVGIGTLELLTNVVVSAMHRDRIASALSYLHSFYSIGAVTATIWASILSSASGQWRLVPMVSIALPAILFVGFLTQTFPSIIEDEQTNPEGEEPLTTMLQSPTFWVCTVLIAGAGAAENGPVVWLPAFAEQVLGVSLGMSGFVLTGFAIFMTLGRLLGGRLGSRYDPLHLLVVGGSLQIVFIIASVLFIPVPAVSFCFCALIGFGISVLWPTALAIAAAKHPNGGAKMYGLLTVFGGCGASLMPSAVGIIKDYTNSLIFGYLFSCVSGAVVVIVAVSFSHWEGGRAGKGDHDDARRSDPLASPPMLRESPRCSAIDDEVDLLTCKGL